MGRLAEDDHDIALVVTRADKRRGRGGGTSPTPVKQLALELGIPVTHRVDDVIDADVDLGVVVAFGRLIRPNVLDRVPMVNAHFSLLPRWRGAAPVERAILAGDEQTGVCLMQLDEGLDTGPIHACEEVDIGREESADELRLRLGELGARMLSGSLRDGLRAPAPQVGEATYAAKIEPHELQIDWTRPAEEIERQVRVGGAWTTFRGRRLKVHRACAHEMSGEGVAVSTGAGPIELWEVQPEGRPLMTAADWARGARWDGTGLGS